MQLVQLFRRGTATRPPNVTVPGPSSMPPPTQMGGFPLMGPPGAQRWQTLQFQTQPIGRSTTAHWQASSAGRQSPPLARRQVSGTSDAAGTATTPEMLAAELDRIPPPTLAKLKRKLGMAGKDLAAMTPEEQVRARLLLCKVPPPRMFVNAHRGSLCSCSVKEPRNRGTLQVPATLAWYWANNRRCVPSPRHPCCPRGSVERFAYSCPRVHPPDGGSPPSQCTGWNT